MAIFLTLSVSFTKRGHHEYYKAFQGKIVKVFFSHYLCAVSVLQMLRKGDYTGFMGIWDRLGSVVKSYLNDYGEEISHGKTPKGDFGKKRQDHSDPDFNAAYEELDDFLNKKNKQADSEASKGAAKESRSRVSPPKSLLQDFAELGLSPEASYAECKAAHKKLLKIHHPDKHTGNENDMKKATEKSARVNASYRRLEDWFRRPG